MSLRALLGWLMGSGGKVGKFRKFCRDEDGSTAIEYVVMAAVMGLIIFTGIATFGGASDGAMTTIMSRVSEALAF